jgi:hypothetical protein
VSFLLNPYRFAGGGGGGPTVPNYPSAGSRVDEFRDDFADGSINAYYNDVGVAGLNETGGEMQVTVPSGSENYIGTLTSLTMASSYFMAKVGIGFASGNYYAQILLWFDGSNNCSMGVDNGNMTFKFTQGGSANHYSGSTITYNATNHQWWRILVSGTTMTFQTSADGTIWSNPFGVTRTLSGTWYTTCNPYMDVIGNAGAGGHVRFDDLNVVP